MFFLAVSHTYLKCTHIYLYEYVCTYNDGFSVYTDMGWLRFASSSKLDVSFAEYSLFYRDLLQKRPIILRSLLIVATPYQDVVLDLCITSERIYDQNTYIHVYTYVCVHIVCTLTDGSVYTGIEMCRWICALQARGRGSWELRGMCASFNWFSRSLWMKRPTMVMRDTLSSAICVVSENYNSSRLASHVTHETIKKHTHTHTHTWSFFFSM